MLLLMRETLLDFAKGVRFLEISSGISESFFMIFSFFSLVFSIFGGGVYPSLFDSLPLVLVSVSSSLSPLSPKGSFSVFSEFREKLNSCFFWEWLRFLMISVDVFLIKEGLFNI